jgi:hypothetical protein
MRKLFLAGVSVLALGVSGAMGQQATVNQNGFDNDAITDQTGATGIGADFQIFIDQDDQVDDGNGHSADVTQTGIGNATTDIDQVGNDNSALVTQNDIVGVGAGGLTTAIINQSGEGQDAQVNQALNNNDVNILQSNLNNTAIVDQVSFGANATVEQEGELGLAVINQGLIGSGNNATIRQLGTSFEADAEINQNGILATATIIQQDVTGAGGKATITQGDANDINIATINQDTTVGANATITQDGFGGFFPTGLNVATINQNNNSFVDATITQDGSVNVATATQNDTAATGSFIDINQTGVGNFADSVQ